MQDCKDGYNFSGFGYFQPDQESLKEDSWRSRREGYRNLALRFKNGLDVLLCSNLNDSRQYWKFLSVRRDNGEDKGFEALWSPTKETGLYPWGIEFRAVVHEDVLWAVAFNNHQRVVEVFQIEDVCSSFIYEHFKKVKYPKMDIGDLDNSLKKKMEIAAKNGWGIEYSDEEKLNTLIRPGVKTSLRQQFFDGHGTLSVYRSEDLQTLSAARDRVRKFAIESNGVITVYSVDPIAGLMAIHTLLAVTRAEQFRRRYNKNHAR
jgi:hypothetical protein